MLAVDEMQSCARRDSRLPLLWSSLSDDELLVRFIQERDDVAFGELVSRHLPLVMGGLLADAGECTVRRQVSRRQAPGASAPA